MRMKRHLPNSFVVFILFSLLGAAIPFLAAEAEEATIKFDDQGALTLPKAYRTWIYVGGSVTPNEMNDGKAAFPEFHNTYIDPQSFRIYKETGKFPEGTIFVKETVDIGSKQSLSGNGYFMGDFVGLFAMVKDSERFSSEPDGWAFFTFKSTAHEAPAKKAQAHPTAACSTCHSSGAQERVFVQYYPILKAANPD